MSDLECLPLKTLNDVMSWTSEGVPNQMKRATIQLQRRQHIDSAVPKTLACHDMKGGYIEDRFIQGMNDYKSYNFYHWNLLDSFVYFNHNFITIPPVTWINVAHRNGVKMLGTLITEWDDGYNRCEEFLSSETAYKSLADQLVKITQFYKFDGWLINIENKIVTEKVQVLCDFVKYLTEKLHEALPGSEVIWYDSVISTGALKWQDQLNEKNCMFFDVCDGIFLNYNWNPEKLNNSRSLAVTKGRQFDVYVGIDVFGRGCPGGGGYNSIEALTTIRQYNLSAAVFAFGWVYETQDRENFIDNENRFWDLLTDLCPTSLWQENVLSSSLCIGAGSQFYVNGEVCDPGPWYNLSLQQIYPYLRRKQVASHKDLPTMEPYFECAFIGGSCLSYNGCLPAGNVPLLFRLFDLNVKYSEPLIVSYSYKTKEENQVFLEVEATSSSGTSRLIFPSDIDQSQSEDMVIRSQSAGDVLGDSCNLLSLPKETSVWKTRWFAVESRYLDGLTLNSMLFGIRSYSKEEQSVQLGQVQMFPKSKLSIPTISNIKASRLSQDKLCVNWDCSSPEDVSYFILYTGGQTSYLGRAASQYYVTTDQSLVSKSTLTLGVQAVLNIGLITCVQSCDLTVHTE